MKAKQFFLLTSLIAMISCERSADQVYYHAFLLDNQTSEVVYYQLAASDDNTKPSIVAINPYQQSLFYSLVTADNTSPASFCLYDGMTIIYRENKYSFSTDDRDSPLYSDRYIDDDQISVDAPNYMHQTTKKFVFTNQWLENQK